MFKHEIEAILSNWKELESKDVFNIFRKEGEPYCRNGKAYCAVIDSITAFSDKLSKDYIRDTIKLAKSKKLAIYFYEEKTDTINSLFEEFNNNKNNATVIRYINSRMEEIINETKEFIGDSVAAYVDANINTDLESIIGHATRVSYFCYKRLAEIKT